jgi:hypothetical protein
MAKPSPTVHARSDADATVTLLDVARTWADTRGADAVLAVTARDGDGVLPLRDGPEGGPDRLYVPTRAPRGGELAIRYRAREEKLWQQRLERAHYDVERARRQYDAVEPENRLRLRSQRATIRSM